MKRAFAIPIILFIAFLFGIYFLLPKYTEFKNLRDKVSKQELSLQQTKTYYSSLQEISNQLENYKESLQNINSALPQEFSLASLLKFFQLKASENGLILKTFSTAAGSGEEKGEEEEKIKIKENYLSLDLIGSISSFENFLKTIEKSSRLVEVENFSFEETEEELPEFTILIKVYSY